jgi:hypothetical protein
MPTWELGRNLVMSIGETNFQADFCLFLYQFCYISGPPSQEEMYLVSKFGIEPKSSKIVSFNIYNGTIENMKGRLSFEGRQTKFQAARAFKLFF